MRVIAIVNQKGGCGKTTTTVNLGGCLAADGHRVLLVDLDPQAHSTLGLGVDTEAVGGAGVGVMRAQASVRGRRSVSQARERNLIGLGLSL